MAFLVCDVDGLMSPTVQLVGLDFGTTTSSAVVASARLLRNAVTGRMELEGVRDEYRSPLVFTPQRDDRLDLDRIEAHLDGWLAAGHVHASEVFGGGALLTGLTARQENAAALVGLLQRRLSNALVATADDPCLESWLAFMGSCAALSREHPGTPILNLDVGGGTTNLALGLNGEVSRTGCLFVGARHVQVEPGTYRLTKLSHYARALLDHLGIDKCPGDCLIEREVDAIVAAYMRLLDGVASGHAVDDALTRLHEQVPFRTPADLGEVAVTLSGGVGELVYRHLNGEPWPGTTAYGDLGIDLARRIAQHLSWAASLRLFRPGAGGRATVYGLLRHSTEISGCTVYLADPDLLPLVDLPILGTIADTSSDDEIRAALALTRSSVRGSCLRVALSAAGAVTVRSLGTRLAQILREGHDSGLPLVLLVRENVGKTLGHYVTEWGKHPLSLVVLDEITVRDAQYVRLGRPREQAVPVSFYGLNP
jgi:ethanolamine utilization protein EutA